MSKTVAINLGNGDLSQGFPRITVRLWVDESLQAEQVIGSLPSAPELVEFYRIWQSTYQALCGRLVLRHPLSDSDGELEIDPGGITQVSQQSFEDVSQQLQQILNRWLESDGFSSIERQVRSRLSPSDDIRVIIETTDDLLHRLPWHCWDFFRDYPHAEMVLSRPEYKRPNNRWNIRRHHNNQTNVRILAILGDRQGIDVAAEQQLLQELADAEVEFLVTPSRQQFDNFLWDTSGWDILFFAGHSQTEGETGRIYINENSVNNSLKVEQLEEALQAAIENGLQLAIFNSCDGVGLAQALGKLHIPQVIVMREPVPNRVAQTFLKYFLEAFARERFPLHRAMRQARRKLEGLEDDFPGASWLPVLCQNPSVEPPTWLQLGGIAPCPYQGLFAFQEADAPLFFGREQATTDLLNAVKQKALVAVIGASGSGKSSIVFAGLMPGLRRGTGTVRWQIVSCRPGIKPFDALAEAWIDVAIEDKREDKRRLQERSLVRSTPEDSFRLRVLELAVDLQQDHQTLCQLIHHHHRNTPDTRLLLIVDQFEELYTLCPEADRQPFLDQLLNAVQSAPAFTLVLTLRADFYGYALSDRRLSDALQGAVYNLGPMSQDELHRAITQPAAYMQVKLESGLTDRLIQATQGQAGRLPLLEFALTELWSQQQAGWLTHQAYSAIGGVEEALANHAERVYAQLHPLDQQRMQRIFLQLVEPGIGTDPSRRLANLDDVGETHWDLVSHLASARLVVTNRNEATGEETVEVVHEALIRSWGRLGAWLHTHGAFRHWQEELRRARRHWEESDREDDALLRGKRLLDAKEWYDSRQEELSDSDRTFIRRSLAVQERENWQRRRKRWAGMVSLVAGLLLALGLAGIAWWGWQNAAMREVQAIATTSNALFVSEARLDALMVALKAEQRLQTLILKDSEIQTEVELALRQAIYGANEYNRLSGHTESVTGVIFSPDGELLASASSDATVNLWKPDGTLLKTLKEHEDEVRGVVFSPTGDRLASASKDQTVRLWRRDGTLLKTLRGHTDAVIAVAFSPDGQILVSGSDDQTLKLWRQDGQLIKSLVGHEGAVKAVAFSPDGNLIASGSDDQTIRLWQRDGTLIRALNGHEAVVRTIAFSPDGELMASGSDDGTIRLWRQDGTFLQCDHRSPVRGVAFSADGERFASVAADTTIKVWKRDGTLLKTLNGHENMIWGVAFSPDNQAIATASRDQTIRLWKLENSLLTFLDGHQDAVWSVAFSPDDTLIASASADQTVKLWNRDGTLIKTLMGHEQPVKTVIFSPDRQRLVTASDDQTIKLWRQDGTLLNTLTGHTGAVFAVAFSPDGSLLASASDDGTVKLWSRDGVLLSTLASHTEAVRAIAFSPDGQRLVSASNDTTVKLWNRDGTLIKTLTGHGDRVYGVAFSPDGERIASGSDDQTVKLWSQDGRELMTLAGHEATVTAVAFNPTGEILASASLDSTIKLWNREGRELATLKGHSGMVTAIAFSRDGRSLISAGQDQKVIVWDLSRVRNFDQILAYSCDWIHDYLKTNRSLNESDSTGNTINLKYICSKTE